MESFDFFLGLTLSHRLYAHTENLPRTWQTQKMSACNSKRNAKFTISVLEKMRCDGSFNQFYDRTQMKGKSRHFIKDPIVPRKRKAPNYSILQFIDGHSSETPAHHPDTSRDRYRAIYYEAIDSMVGSIKDRFKQPSFEVYEHLESLLLKSISSIDASKEIAYLKETHKGDVDYLQSEVKCSVLRVMFNEGQLQHFKDIYTRLKEVDYSQLSLIPSTITISKLLLVNPATTATAEQSFSAARRIKTWMHLNMLALCLNSMSILLTHKLITDKLYLKAIE